MYYKTLTLTPNKFRLFARALYLDYMRDFDPEAITFEDFLRIQLDIFLDKEGAEGFVVILSNDYDYGFHFVQTEAMVYLIMRELGMAD
jgi:hypothetical protein